MKARGEGLLEAHEVVPRPELSTMGVTGELQVESGIRGSNG